MATPGGVTGRQATAACTRATTPASAGRLTTAVVWAVDMRSLWTGKNETVAVWRLGETSTVMVQGQDGRVEFLLDQRCSKVVELELGPPEVQRNQA